MAVELMMDYRSTRNNNNTNCINFVAKLEEKSVVQEAASGLDSVEKLIRLLSQSQSQQIQQQNKSPMEIEMVADAAVTKFKKVISLLDRNRTGHARFRRAPLANNTVPLPSNSIKDFVDTKVYSPTPIQQVPLITYDHFNPLVPKTISFSYSPEMSRTNSFNISSLTGETESKQHSSSNSAFQMTNLSYNPLIFTIKNPKVSLKPHSSLPSSVPTSRLRIFQNFSVQSSISSSNEPEKPTSITPDNDKADDKTVEFVDEWGEKSELEPGPVTKLADSDPPEYDDEWGNGSPGVDVSGEEDDKLLELKRCLVDTVYGTDFGFRASSEIRAEALEFVSQLEAANPSPAPTESPELLDGNWILVFTAFSELLPLLAVGNIPLLKVEKISQDVNTNSSTIENATTLSSPVATLSFSATATFEVRSPSRIQVEFKEGNFKPPEIKSNIDLPETVDLFGQKISLSPVQQSLGPLENAVAGIARTISGQPPLKIPIPGERTKSWLLTTYLDKDMRISRGDGGLFVLVKEGSSLLY